MNEKTFYQKYFNYDQQYLNKEMRKSFNNTFKILFVQ
jgi:hypothetical protein